MSLARKAAILICAAYPLLAAPRLTTIQDTIYKADGTRFSGTAVISWTPFDASDSSKIGLQSLTVPILNGSFRVQLVPNSDATPVNYYNVRYSSDGKAQFSENWSVPPTTTMLRIKDVRVQVDTSSGANGGGVVQSSGGNPVTESAVIGLLTDLSIRPTKGQAYGSGRAAMVDDNGSLNTVLGNLSDCVKVDGSSGPCFDATQLPTFIDQETPAGMVDGSNASFTFANPLSPTSSLSLTRNGLLQQAGSDFNVQTDGSILFVTAAIPQPGDVLVASYRTSPVSSSLVVALHTGTAAIAAQVLCSSTGTSTAALTAVSLGSCILAANTLSAGDRVEVRYTFAHHGVSKGFVFSMLWGGLTLAQRTAAPLDAIIIGRADAAIAADGTSLASQTWGTLLALESGVASVANALTLPLKIDFQAQMSALGTDTVELQNYTVLRYPAH